MKNIYNVGIVGLGVVGQRLISEFKKHSDIHIVALCDFNQELIQETVQQCEGAHCFSDYHDLLQLEEIDFVYIAVPPAVHYQVVMAAFQHNKHVLCEKPLANSEQEALEMLSTAEKSGLIHAMHFPLVYEQAYATIEKMMSENAFGEIKRITLKMHFDRWPRPWQQTNWINSRLQGGFTREISPHYLQMILHFFGEVKEVSSSIDFPADPELSEKGVIATLKLENGVKVLIDGLVGQAEKEEIAFTIHGSKQSLSLLNWRQVNIATKGEGWTTLDPSLLVPSNSSLVEEFVKKLNKQEAKVVGFDQGLRIQEVLEKLIEQ
ncbi:Gfo/Idh/MocA family protein [Sutcliffiella horikoshii]|uniref:Gfo/Idh/MocA family protein n=1 Tax=Sutcliffiella horikoshii TaxID=79883 RepID=UPI001F3612A8|nr:Gfo/Idh/MocA family oxidoreductase [Sutcliffiella horikoshii]MCG1020927.1 Gfo/Idh/MocA family oxidoreductase [Sutcliffiella horikoshii]